MKSVICALILISVAATARADDTTQAMGFGEALKEGGIISSYRLRSPALQLFAMTNSVTDARTFAQAVCREARTYRWANRWKAQVFILSSERPAATCRM